MKVELDLRWLRVETETSWRQIALFCAFLIFVFGLWCMLQGVDKEVALAVVAALGAIIGGFALRPRDSQDSKGSSRHVRYINRYRLPFRILAVAYIYSMCVYLIFLM